MNYKKIEELGRLCKKKGNKFYISNNLKLAIKLKCDGVYLSAFNRKHNFINKATPKKFEFIGSAHNQREIIEKENQGCEKIFISPVFKNKKSNHYLGLNKFNNLSFKTKKKIIALGGIDERNYKMLNSLNCNGFAAITWIKKNGPRKLGPF